MIQPLTTALKILGHFWLEEVQPGDLDTIQALPELAETLPQTNTAVLTDLSVEYQRLFGFNLPPYESVFIDPSAMLMAPATERVQALYRKGSWLPPGGTRAGAPDHLGLELLALADWLQQDRTELARRLQVDHLALWAPLFLSTLSGLAPPLFYARLAELTLALLLSTLPANPLPAGIYPFPDLPPPPKYRDSGAEWLLPETQESDLSSPAVETETPGLRRIVKRLLTPRKAGLFLTREDIGRLSRTLDLPGVVGERYRMLDTLLRLAGQYDLLPDLARHLGQLLSESDSTYATLAADYPAWSPYAAAWRRRLADSQRLIDSI